MKDAASDLVRIDEKGEAHPIGVEAARRLRGGRGTYRLLPSPDHVVFMRYTGEDGRRDPEDGALVRMAGEIAAPGALCDVLAMIGHTRWRGELVVQIGDVRRSLFLEYGNVVGATTSVADERLGSVMYRFGALDEALLRAVLARVKAGARFGEAVVELGLATQDQVYGYLAKQIQEIAFAVLAVDDGTYFFLDGFSRERLVSHHSLSISGLLMEGVTRLDEIRYFRNTIPSEEWVPVPSDRTEAPPDELEAVYLAVDGRRSVADIGRLTGLGEFETTKAIYGLAQSHHVEMRRPRLTGGLESVATVANEALRLVHRRLDDVGQGADFRAKLDDFAVGAGVYDMLFRAAGPHEDGTFATDQMAANAKGVAGDDPEQFLIAKLREYLGFALFCAGTALGSEAENALAQELAAMLAELQPRG